MKHSIIAVAFTFTSLMVASSASAEGCIDEGWTPIPGTQNACHYTGNLYGNEVFAQRVGQGPSDQPRFNVVVDGTTGKVLRDERRGFMDERRVKTIN